MKGRTFLAITAALFLLLLLSAAPFALAQEKKPLAIGAVFSVTGKAAALGDPEAKTVVMIVDQINKAGGVNGFPLQLTLQDDESLETKAVADVEKLINQDRVLAVIGPSVSGNSLQVKPICEKAKVPMVSCAAAEAIVTPPESSRYIFKTPQLDSHVAIRILEHSRNLGITKIGILTDTLPFGQQGRKQLQQHAKELGITIVADETYGPSVTDMRPQLERIQAAGAGAVVNWSVLPVQTIVPKNMKAMGMRIPLFYSHGFGNPKMIAAAGEAGEGIMFPTGRLLAVDVLAANHPQKKILDDYKNAYESRYKSPVSTFGGHAYDALWLVVNAMKARNVTPDMPVDQARQAIRDGLEQTKGWLGIAGTFHMSANDHTGLDKYDSLEMLVVAKDGKVVPLAQHK
jgi:branched-chain amino acid transport system substrate-binding protein